MDQVVGFEKKRSGLWLKKYWFLILMLFLGVIFSAGIILLEYLNEDLGFYLSLYLLDWEMVQVLWREALDFLWSMTPQTWAWTGLLLYFFIIGVIFITRPKRRVIKRKLDSLKRYNEL